jgi:predicted DNA-binding protein (UPF0251 family)
LSERVAADGLNPSEAADRGEQTRAVREAVMSLPNDLREAIVLFEYEDMSHEQISQITGSSKKAVETRLYRARGILRERLKRWLFTYETHVSVWHKVAQTMSAFFDSLCNFSWQVVYSFRSRCVRRREEILFGIVTGVSG